jgi:hypothetical protein
VLAFALIPSSHLAIQHLDAHKGLQMENADWFIYQVDRGLTNSVDVDSSLLPVIAYHGYGERGLRLASWSGGSWLIDKVDDEEGAGGHQSLVLDDEDDPAVAYWNAWPHPDAGALKIARWEEVNWTFEVVDNKTGAHTSMVLDSNGIPRLAYMDAPNPGDYPHLWFASKNPNGSWTYEPVDTNDSLRYPSLAIDRRDLYHISYEELGTELRYAHWNGTNWTIEIVDTEGVVGAWSSIKVDNSGRPHIAYYDGTHGNVKYATKSNNSWNRTSIDNSPGNFFSLDLDSHERPHVSYHSAERNLKHAYWNGSAWNIEVVDNTTGVGTLASMRIDDHDDIHISYSDRSDPKIGYVKYASTKELPTGGIAANIDIDPDTLNLKSKGKFITAYIELEGADVRDIDASSILLNGAISPILDEKYGFVTSEDSYIVDHDNDGIMERMVKFDRGEVQRLLTPADEVVLAVSGFLFDGAEFGGSDTIRVIDPP